MKTHNYSELLENNATWSKKITELDPQYFSTHAKGQSPPFLVIGCADSRLTLNTLTGTTMGELFVHRNIANQVHPDDDNIQSVLDYAILSLKVKHVIVCGHTQCGGVMAAHKSLADGVLGRWLSPLSKLSEAHQSELLNISDETQRLSRLSELNVLAQLSHIKASPSFKQAVQDGHQPHLHGWVFQIESGLIKELSA